MTPLGERITSASKAAGLSRAESARRSGLSPQHMQQLCDGRVSDSKHLPAIANTLGVDVAWLTTGSQEHAPPWARTSQPDPSSLATAQADLDRARAANALLAEQLSDALAEVARLRLQVQGTSPPTDATAATTAPRHRRPTFKPTFAEPVHAPDRQ